MESRALQHHSASVSENDAAGEKSSHERQKLNSNPSSGAGERSNDQDQEAAIAEIWAIAEPRAVVSCSLTEANKAVIREMLHQGGTVKVVKRAIQLGSLRKLAARVNHCDESQIRSLRYFVPLIDEVMRVGDSDYWQHVERRLIREERRWISSKSAPARRSAEMPEAPTGPLASETGDKLDTNGHCNARAGASFNLEVRETGICRADPMRPSHTRTRRDRDKFHLDHIRAFSLCPES